MGKFLVNLNAAGVAATTRYILIDKSDTSGFPHGADEALKLDRLIIAAAPGADGAWEIRIGVVEEVDGTNGSVTFFLNIPIDNGNPVYLPVDFGPRGKSMEESAVHMLGSNDVNGSTNWQTDVDLANPTGTDTAPGAGDIVVEVVEVDGTATVTFSITAEYDLVSAR